MSAMKDKKEFYEKVEIKSEKDLPKKDGDYIVHSKAFDWIGLATWKAFENANYPEYNQYLWLLNYDWYFLSVELHKQIEAEGEKINTNNPFFGNSGAVIPAVKGMDEVEILTEDQMNHIAESYASYYGGDDFGAVKRAVMFGIKYIIFPLKQIT